MKEESMRNIFFNILLLMRDEKIINQKDVQEISNFLQEKIRNNKLNNFERQSVLPKINNIQNSFAGVKIINGGK